MSSRRMLAVILSIAMLLSLIVFDSPLAIAEEIDLVDANAVLAETIAPMQVVNPMPTDAETSALTDESTVEPTDEATAEPTDEVTFEPSLKPTIEAPVEPTDEASVEPTDEATMESADEVTMEPTDEAAESVDGVAGEPDVRVSEDEMTATITLDKSTVAVGETITGSWTVTGGTAPYTYEYRWRSWGPGGWGSDYVECSVTSASFTPCVGTAGYLNVIVTDATGYKKGFESIKFTITGAPVLDPLGCTITLDKTSVAVGDTITANWTVTGGMAPYTYHYSWVSSEQDGSEIWDRGDTTQTTASFTPRVGVEGFFFLDVCDAVGIHDIFESDIFVIQQMKCAIMFDKDTVAVGSEITANWTVTGGTAPYQYKYTWNLTEANGETIRKSGAGTTANSSYSPLAGVCGNVQVEVTDAKGLSQTFESPSFMVTGATTASPLVASVNLDQTSVTHGKAITAIVTASGGTTPYTYEYVWAVTEANGVVTEEKGSSTSATLSYTPSKGVSGSLTITVDDACGRQVALRTEEFSIQEGVYTITFDTEGGSAVNTIAQAYNTIVTAPANPTKAGYTFAGWLPTVPATMPAEDIACIAQWTANQYKITFDTKGGSAVNTIAQAYNTGVMAPENPTKTGYTFAGWVPAVPSKMPAANITCVAQWKANQYKITFDTKGGSAVGTITQAYDTAVTAPTNPTKIGYIFAGWVPAVPTKMPVENITCVAQWKAILSSITAPNVVVGVGQTAKIAYELQPSGATAESITFTSKDKKIATIDANGNIKGIKAGSTTITIAADRSVKCTIKVTVKKAPKSVSIKAGKTALGVGEQTTAAVTLSSGSAGSWTYSTSNVGIATVDAGGTISAIGVGTATITARTYNGKKSTVKITVLAAPSGVTLNTDTLTLGMGASAALTATLSKNSTGAYTFSSGNTKVATVDAKGVVKALSKGTAVITVETYNGKKDTCTVTVVDAPTKVILTADRKTIGIGENIQLGVEVQPKTASGTPTFSSSKTSVATVSATGLMKAKKAGTTTITATMYNGVKTTIKITVKKAPTSVSIKAGKTTSGVGEATTTSVKLSSGSAGSWMYSTSNAGVATVDASGKITAVGVGKATITVKTHNGKTGTVKITVLTAPTGVTLNADTLTLGMGASATLTATLSKNSAGAYAFSTSNVKVATVDAKGGVKALSKGTAVITVETYNGKKDTCTVTVVDAPTKVVLTADRKTIGIGEKIQLGIEVQPKTASGTPTFSSSKTSVATVSATGLMKAKKAGTTTITATMYNGVKTTIKITVKKAPTSVSIKAGKTTLGVGEATITSVKLSSGSAGSWMYSTSNAGVATADASGKITAVGAGSATITVKTYNGKTATMKITVK